MSSTNSKKKPPQSIAAYLAGVATRDEHAATLQRAEERLQLLAVELESAERAEHDADDARAAAMEADIAGTSSAGRLETAERAVDEAERATGRAEGMMRAAEAVRQKSQRAANEAGVRLQGLVGPVCRDLDEALLPEIRAAFARAFELHVRRLRLRAALGAATTGEIASLGHDGSPGSIAAIARTAGLSCQAMCLGLAPGGEVPRHQLPSELTRALAEAA